jgi:hypothetical protein
MQRFWVVRLATIQTEWAIQQYKNISPFFRNTEQVQKTLTNIFCGLPLDRIAGLKHYMKVANTQFTTQLMARRSVALNNSPRLRQKATVCAS